MLEQIFNSPSMDYLGRGMQAAHMRHDVISNNIANVNTPKFKKSNVVFEDLLAKELDMDKTDKLEMVRTHDQHLPVGGNDKAMPRIEVQDTTTMRTDHNNVDIDVEMAGMAKNHIYYNALVRELSGYVSRVKSVIQSK